MPRILVFELSGQIPLDDVSVSDMEDEGYDPASGTDVADYLGMPDRDLIDHVTSRHYQVEQT